MIVSAQFLVFCAALFVVIAAVTWRWRAFFLGGVPDISPQALGLFRIAWGLSLLYAILRYGELEPGDVRDYEWWGGWGWIDALVRSETALTLVELGTAVALVLFIVGLWTRAAHAAAAVGFTLYVLTMSEGSGTHDWGLPLIAFLTGVLVPWGDGLSLDARRRARRGEPAPETPSPAYGLGVWLPGLVMGIAFLAAAWAKYKQSGLDWALDGAVRYHFVDDADAAPVHFGMWVAVHENAARLAATGGMVIEAAFIAHVLFRSALVRGLFGLGALGLLGGFFIFQGLFWYPWWTLLLAFLPWQAIWETVAAPERRVAAAAIAPRRLGTAVAVLVSALLVAQAFASRVWIERLPFLSNYSMYSHTYSSPAAYDETNLRALSEVRLRLPDSGRDVTPEVAVLAHDNGRAVLRDAVGDVAASAPVSGAVLPLPDPAPVQALRAEYEQRNGAAPRAFDVIANTRPFDWKEGRFRDWTEVLVGSVVDDTVLVAPRVAQPLAPPPAATAGPVVVLDTFAGEQEARQAAERATQRGLGPAGVIAPATAFAGPYGSEEDARRAAGLLTALGFADARVRSASQAQAAAHSADQTASG